MRATCSDFTPIWPDSRDPAVINASAVHLPAARDLLQEEMAVSPGARAVHCAGRAQRAQRRVRAIARRASSSSTGVSRTLITARARAATPSATKPLPSTRAARSPLRSRTDRLPRHRDRDDARVRAGTSSQRRAAHGRAMRTSIAASGHRRRPGGDHRQLPQNPELSTGWPTEPSTATRSVVGRDARPRAVESTPTLLTWQRDRRSRTQIHARSTSSSEGTAARAPSQAGRLDHCAVHRPRRCWWQGPRSWSPR